MTTATMVRASVRNACLTFTLLACGGAISGDAAPPPTRPVQYWDLGTGSHIAYAHIPSAIRPATAAVVFLHGGPGAYQVASFERAREWYTHLAGLGFDIYAYDQVGSGLSGRLQDPAEYSVARHLADLEAIRELIGAPPRLILVGDSWGATLAANYLAAYPGNVASAIFTSPGAIDPADHNVPYPAPRLDRELLQWIAQARGPDGVEHYLELDRLLARDVRAAHAFAPDAEMDSLFSSFLNAAILSRATADPARLRAEHIEMHGMGWWANALTNWDAVNRKPRAKPLLESCDVPVLVLRGDADYLPAQIADEYRHTFPHARFVRVPNAGHFIWLDQPAVYGREIEAFLLGAGPPAAGR